MHCQACKKLHATAPWDYTSVGFSNCIFQQQLRQSCSHTHRHTKPRLPITLWSHCSKWRFLRNDKRYCYPAQSNLQKPLHHLYPWWSKISKSQKTFSYDRYQGGKTWLCYNNKLLLPNYIKELVNIHSSTLCKRERNRHRICILSHFSRQETRSSLTCIQFCNRCNQIPIFCNQKQALPWHWRQYCL